MKLFVIGATGRTGEEIVQQALARGYHVTAFVRSPEAVTMRHERLGVLEGNVTDEEQLSGQCEITMRSFPRWVRAGFSNQVRFFTTVRLRVFAQCSVRE